MQMILDVFALGGPWMYLILVSDLVGFPCLGLAVLVGATSRVTKKGVLFARILAWSVVLGSLVPLLLGGLGTGMGFFLLEKAVTAAAPEMVEEMRAAGARVAMLPLKFGGVSSLLYIFPSFIAVVLVPSRADLEADGHY